MSKKTCFLNTLSHSNLTAFVTGAVEVNFAMTVIDASHLLGKIGEEHFLINVGAMRVQLARYRR